MKFYTILFSIVAFFCTCPANAQHQQGIEVTGSAEMKIVPDEIEWSLTISEYSKVSKRVTIEEVEQELFKAAKSSGIASTQMAFLQTGSFTEYSRDGKEKTRFITKTFMIKLNHPDALNKIVMKMDPMAIRQTYLSNSTHSKLNEYKIDLRIRAMKAAKEKATYMLQSVDERVGKLLFVQEIEEPLYQPMQRSANVMMRSEMDTEEVNPTPEFSEIKIKVSVRAVFEIVP